VTRSRHRGRRTRLRPRRQAPGTPPGALVQRADAKPSRIVVRRFGPETYAETPLASDADLATLRE